MVGGDGVLPLPWLGEAVQRGLQSTAHALLVHGPDGVGQFELASTLAQAWLCEEEGQRPCGHCKSCRLVQARAHPDLLVIVPDALRESLGWSGGDQEDSGEKGTKGKPSREIKVEALRAAVQFAQTTSARGRGKALVVHPAERMNAIAANTLLKTLEEPPGNARFLLVSAAPDTLLPTIRSRCQALPLDVPAEADSVAWLTAQGVPEAAVLLAACGGQPLLALQWHAEGVDATTWRRLPLALSQGDAAAIAAWPLPRVVQALQKVCHDAISLAVGAEPRYFPAASLSSKSRLPALIAWSRELLRLAPDAEHPWSPGLAVEALVDVARHALAGPPRSSRRAGIGRYT